MVQGGRFKPRAKINSAIREDARVRTPQPATVPYPFVIFCYILQFYVSLGYLETLVGWRLWDEVFVHVVWLATESVRKGGRRGRKRVVQAGTGGLEDGSGSGGEPCPLNPQTRRPDYDGCGEFWGMRE